jgi:hypothetical protein
VPPTSSRGRARFEVRFDELAFQEDLGRATARGREVALQARRRLERDGADSSELLRCQAEHREGTALPNCVKVYLPRPDGRWGMVFELARKPSSGTCCSPTSPSANATPARRGDLTSIGVHTGDCVDRAADAVLAHARVLKILMLDRVVVSEPEIMWTCVATAWMAVAKHGRSRPASRRSWVSCRPGRDAINTQPHEGTGSQQGPRLSLRDGRAERRALIVVLLLLVPNKRLAGIAGGTRIPWARRRGVPQGIP